MKNIIYIFLSSLIFTVSASFTLENAQAQTNVLEMSQSCDGLRLGNPKRYPISTWDGRSENIFSQTAYDFFINCDGSTKHIMDVYLASIDDKRYEKRGNTLYKHTKDENKYLPIPESERGCRTVQDDDWCARTPKELFKICGNDGLCKIEHSAYRCKKSRRECEKPRNEYRYVAKWEPFPTGYAPLPSGARIVKIAAPRPVAPVSSANTPTNKTPISFVPAAQPPGILSMMFGSLPILQFLLFLPCAAFVGIARVGDFDKTATGQGIRLAAVGGVLCLMWIAGASGSDMAVQFLLFFAFPAAVIWLLSSDFERFSQGFVFMRVRPSSDGLSEYDAASLRHTLEETRDTLKGGGTQSMYWQRINERALTEALKSTTVKRREQSDHLRATTDTVNETGNLFDASITLETKGHLKKQYVDVEHEEQLAALEGKLADARRSRAEKETAAFDADVSLEAAEKFKDQKLKLGKERIKSRIRDAKTQAVDSDTDLHTSKQARDDVKDMGTQSEEGSKEDKNLVDDVDAYMAAEQEKAVQSGDHERASFLAAERARRMAKKTTGASGTDDE